MIKQLVNLVMPKQLGAIGTIAALSALSTGVKVFGSKRREDEINEAQQKKEASDRIIRAEQAGRIRRRQIKQGQIANSQIEAAALAGGSPGSSGQTNATSAVQSNVATNISDLNTGLATGNINASLNANISNAGKKTDFEIFNDIASPALNIGLGNQISKAFS